ncbi:MAG: iron chelate uptake ABC transporter family permease subunit, partial [Balneolaceae bacterium]
MSASWKASTQPGSQSGKLSDALSNLTSASVPLADTGGRTHHPAVKASNRTAILTILGVLLLFVTLLSAAIGAVSIPFSQLSAILLSKIGIHLPVEIDPRADLVLTGIRLPRVLLGVLAGMALAVSGALMQGLFRNPLADPAGIGIS